MRCTSGAHAEMHGESTRLSLDGSRRRAHPWLRLPREGEVIDLSW
jgi:hypothetical protein